MNISEWFHDQLQASAMVSYGAHSKYQMHGETSDHLRLSVNGQPHATFSTWYSTSKILLYQVCTSGLVKHVQWKA